jgi:hypothetical protein
MKVIKVDFVDRKVLNTYEVKDGEVENNKPNWTLIYHVAEDHSDISIIDNEHIRTRSFYYMKASKPSYVFYKEEWRLKSEPTNIVKELSSSCTSF